MAVSNQSDSKCGEIMSEPESTQLPIPNNLLRDHLLTAKCFHKRLGVGRARVDYQQSIHDLMSNWSISLPLQPSFTARMCPTELTPHSLLSAQKKLSGLKTFIFTRMLDPQTYSFPCSRHVAMKRPGNQSISNRNQNDTFL